MLHIICAISCFVLLFWAFYTQVFGFQTDSSKVMTGGFIMDSIISKFSLYDFFNLVFCGGIVIVGLHLMGYSPIVYIIETIDAPGYEFLNFLIIFLLCYLVGYVFQGIGSWFTSDIIKLQSRLTQNCLNKNDNDVFGDEKDQTKLIIHRKNARKVFQLKGIISNNETAEDEENTTIPKDQCEYFFAYCSYVLQINGLAQKCEKMRALKGLSCLWMTAFTALSLANLIKLIVMLLGLITGNEFEGLITFGFCVLFAVLAVNSFFRMKENIIKWIRMVLAVYDAYTDQENKVHKI